MIRKGCPNGFAGGRGVGRAKQVGFLITGHFGSGIEILEYSIGYFWVHYFIGGISGYVRYFGYLGYTRCWGIPKISGIPDDFQNWTGSGIGKMMGSGRVLGTRWALGGWGGDWKKGNIWWGEILRTGIKGRLRFATKKQQNSISWRPGKRPKTQVGETARHNIFKDRVNRTEH